MGKVSKPVQIVGVTATYNGNVGGAVRQEVVFELGKVDATTGNEFKSREDLDDNGILAFDKAEDLLLLLGDLSAQGSQVLDDLGSTSEVGQGGNVMQRGILSEQRGARRSQELLVSRRHCEC